MTFVGRSQRGRLFHVASAVEERRVLWLCGASTRFADPRHIPIPVGETFGGVEGGEICKACWTKHNNRAMRLQDEKQKPSPRLNLRCAELNVLVERAVAQGFIQRRPDSFSAVDEAFLVADELRREGHWETLRDSLLMQGRSHESR